MRWIILRFYWNILFWHVISTHLRCIFSTCHIHLIFLRLTFQHNYPIYFLYMCVTLTFYFDLFFVVFFRFFISTCAYNMLLFRHIVSIYYFDTLLQCNFRLVLSTRYFEKLFRYIISMCCEILFRLFFIRHVSAFGCFGMLIRHHFSTCYFDTLFQFQNIH